MKKILTILIFLMLGAANTYGEEIVFSGLPLVRISEGGIERTPEHIDKEKALEFICVIVKNGDKFYWATRDNLELIPIQSGAFTTFIAINGSGYIRIIDSDTKGFASYMSNTEKKFDYIEHLLIGLRSVAYYGIKEEN